MVSTVHVGANLRLSKGQHRVPFRNFRPSSNERYYAVREADVGGDLEIEWSSDGTSWTNTPTVIDAGTGYDSFDVKVRDTGTELHVYVVYITRGNSLRYRRLVIADTDDAPGTIGAASSIIGIIDGITAEPHACSISRTANGRLVVAYTNDSGLMGNIYRTTRLRGSDNDGAAPDWSVGAVTWNDPSSDMDNAGKGQVWMATYPFNSSFPNRFLLVARLPDGLNSTAYNGTSDYVDWNGTAFTSNNKAGFEGASLDPLKVVSVVIDSTDRAHVIFYDYGAATLSSRKAATAGQNDWEAQEAVKANDVDAGSLSIDLTASPDKLYVFYHDAADSVDFHYKVSPVDTILWGLEQTITIAQDVTALSTAQQEQANGIHIAGQYGTVVFYHEITLAVGAYELDAGPGAYGLTGILATAIVTRFINAQAGNYAKTGIASTLEYGRGINAESGSYTASGMAAILQTARFMNAIAGGYSLDGIAAILTFGRGINALAGLYSLSGVASTLEYGRGINAVAGGYGITGDAASLIAARLLDASVGDYDVIGAPSTLARGHSFNAEAGSYDVAGQAAILLLGYGIIADPGSYGLSGLAAILLRDYVFVANAGNYVIVGLDGEIIYSGAGAFVLDAGPGNYGLSGTAGTLVTTRILSLDPISYALSGLDTTFLVGRGISADPGSYGLIGLEAIALATRKLSVDPGVYGIVGSEATFLLARGISVDPGIYGIIGKPATVLATRFLSLDPIVYILSGVDAILATGRRLSVDAGLYLLTGIDATLIGPALTVYGTIDALIEDMGSETSSVEEMGESTFTVEDVGDVE